LIYLYLFVIPVYNISSDAWSRVNLTNAKCESRTFVFTPLSVHCSFCVKHLNQICASSWSSIFNMQRVRVQGGEGETAAEDWAGTVKGTTRERG